MCCAQCVAAWFVVSHCCILVECMLHYTMHNAIFAQMHGCMVELSVHRGEGAHMGTNGSVFLQL